MKRVGLGVLLFALLYAGAALDLSAVPVNGFPEKEGKIALYLRADGGHLDLVLPVRNLVQDWRKIFPVQNTRSKDNTLSWISIGWGEKGFYLHPPTAFSETLFTSLQAVVGWNSAVLRVEYVPQPTANDTCRLIHATEAEYRKLTGYILQSLSPNENDQAQWIAAPEICGRNDAFYEARGTYSLFNTCNTWVNSGLKTAGVRACIWTPLPQALLDKYPIVDAKNKHSFLTLKL